MESFKLILVLPLFAIVFRVFAAPEYSYATPSASGIETILSSSAAEKEARGVVVDEDGNPLKGVRIIVSRTITGATTDDKGRFSISKIPDGSSLIFSCAGFKSYIMLPLISSNYAIRVRLVKDPDYQKKITVRTSDGSEVRALIVIDGVISENGIGKVDPNSILSINVLKEEAATGKYGEKGLEGVIEITTKQNSVRGVVVDEKGQPLIQAEEPFVVVEEMPSYPGGEAELLDFIAMNKKYPEEAKADTIQGKVFVRFIVNTEGNTEGISVLKGVHPLLDAEAIRVVNLQIPSSETLPLPMADKVNRVPLPLSRSLH